MTSTGYVVLPLCLLVLWLPRAWSIPAVFIASTLADAAIANPANRPIQVAWLMALLLIARVFWWLVTGQATLRLDIVRRLFPLAAFILACVLSLLLALAFFQREVIVLPGSAELNPLLAQPYRLTPENLNQLAYLCLILVFVYAVAHIAVELGREALTFWLDRAMRWSFSLATFVTVWHIASFTIGIWFPNDFFHSSIHAGAWDQGIAGLHRPSGPFQEPSVLGYYYVMYMFYFWQRWRGTHRIGDELCFLIAVAMLILSTSTTAYLMLVAFIGLALLDAVGPKLGLRGMSGSHRSHGGRRPIRAASALLVVLALGGGLWAAERYAPTIDAVIDEQIRSKSGSLSAEIRGNADRMAANIVVETYGLGMGLGSHRSSSGLLTLLAGAGVLGTLAFIWLFASLLRDSGTGPTGKALRWALLGLLGCHVLTVPELQSVPLWSLVALSIALRLGARAGASSQPSAGPVAALAQRA